MERQVFSAVRALLVTIVTASVKRSSECYSTCGKLRAHNACARCILGSNLLRAPFIYRLAVGPTLIVIFIRNIFRDITFHFSMRLFSCLGWTMDSTVLHLGIMRSLLMMFCNIHTSFILFIYLLALQLIYWVPLIGSSTDELISSPN